MMLPSALVYGQLVAKKRITDDPAGFTELVETLTAAGDSAEDPIPVAIETPRGRWSRRCARPAGRCMR